MAPSGPEPTGARKLQQTSDVIRLRSFILFLSYLCYVNRSQNEQILSEQLLSSYTYMYPCNHTQVQTEYSWSPELPQALLNQTPHQYVHTILSLLPRDTLPVLKLGVPRTAAVCSPGQCPFTEHLRGCVQPQVVLGCCHLVSHLMKKPHSLGPLSDWWPFCVVPSSWLFSLKLLQTFLYLYV